MKTHQTLERIPANNEKEILCISVHSGGRDLDFTTKCNYRGRIESAANTWAGEQITVIFRAILQDNLNSPSYMLQRNRTGLSYCCESAISVFHVYLKKMIVPPSCHILFERESGDYILKNLLTKTKFRANVVLVLFKRK